MAFVKYRTDRSYILKCKTQAISPNQERGYFEAGTVVKIVDDRVVFHTVEDEFGNRAYRVHINDLERMTE